MKKLLTTATLFASSTALAHHGDSMAISHSAEHALFYIGVAIVITAAVVIYRKTR